MSEEISWILNPADAQTFTGPAFSTLLGGAEQEVPVKLYYVRFHPGARTNWHIHSGAQTLLVTRGTCRYQREGEPVREIGAGESIRFEPGVKHWHGASPDDPAEHIALNVENARTTWLKQVSEEDYSKSE